MKSSSRDDQPWSSSMRFCIAVSAYCVRNCEYLSLSEIIVGTYCEDVTLASVDDTGQLVQAVPIEELFCELLFLLAVNTPSSLKASRRTLTRISLRREVSARPSRWSRAPSFSTISAASIAGEFTSLDNHEIVNSSCAQNGKGRTLKDRRENSRT